MLKLTKKSAGFKKVLSVLLAVAALFSLLPMMTIEANAADKAVYYPVDFSDAMLKSGVGQRISKDCQFVTVVTMEAYMVGATTSKDKDKVYTAVKNANPGSTSGKPNAEVIQSPNWGKTIGYESMTYSLENLYREISRGNPVMIYRAGTSTKSPHWSVVCGYTGSTSKLEESGFQMVNVSHSGVNKTNLKTWRNGNKIIGCRRRTFGVAVTAFSGIRFCVDHPAIVQKKGETFGAFGNVVSDHKLTNVTVSVTEAISGRSIYNKSVDPKAKNCDIKKNFDKSVTMAKWAEGDYYYTISATDAAGNSSTYNRFFTIRASYPATAPKEPDWSDVATEIAEPVVDSVATLVDPVPPEESIPEVITDAAETVIDQAETVIEQTPPEESIPEVITDATETVIDQAETIVEQTPPEESIPEVITDATETVIDQAETVIEQAPPVEILLNNSILPSGTIAQGSAFTVSGVLSSELSLSSVTFTVADESGSVVFQADAAPGSTEYSLYDMDSQLTFSKLACGSYTWNITAVNETSCSLWDGSFSVKETDVKGSDCTYPQGTLTKGKTFSCKGIVSSGSEIALVTMSVYSVDGLQQFEASAAPNATSYDLHNLDAQMTFRNLDSGRYVYRVTVTDANGVARNVITTSFAVQ